jgi:hypothetical protein
MRLNWGNPKITLGEFHTYLQTLIGSQLDGLVDDGGYLYINTNSPLNGEQENAILSYYYSLSGAAQEVKMSSATSLSGVKEPNGMRARLVGAINQTITAGQTVNCDWLVPQLTYKGVNKPSIFDGIEYFAENAKVGDRAQFQVVDKTGFGVLAGWYSQATFDAMGNCYVVEEFGKDWAMMPNEQNQISLYRALLVPGLHVRLKYTSTGSVDVNLVVNLFRHMDAT